MMTKYTCTHKYIRNHTINDYTYICYIMKWPDKKCSRKTNTQILISFSFRFKTCPGAEQEMWTTIAQDPRSPRIQGSWHHFRTLLGDASDAGSGKWPELSLSLWYIMINQYCLSIKTYFQIQINWLLEISLLLKWSQPRVCPSLVLHESSQMDPSPMMGTGDSIHVPSWVDLQRIITTTIFHQTKEKPSNDLTRSYMSSGMLSKGMLFKMSGSGAQLVQWGSTACKILPQIHQNKKKYTLIWKYKKNNYT